MQAEKGFLASLFDLSFKEFITPKVIRIVYAVTLLICGLGALFMFIGFAQKGVGGMILGLILAPLFFIAYAVVARIWLEVVLILFAIEKNTRKSEIAPPSGIPDAPRETP